MRSRTDVIRSGLFFALTVTLLGAQDASDWQTAAGGKMAFEVASIKQSKGAFVPPSFPLSAGNAFRPTGGYFKADFPLSVYIQFAYKIWTTEEQDREFAHLPAWASEDRYTVDAKRPGNPTKDQMRLMMQALLADRFKLAVHYETREVSAVALTVAKEGKLGPKLIAHSDGPPCETQPLSSAPPAKGVLFPPICDSMAMLRKAGGKLMLMGYRNATMDVLAATLYGVVGRPVIDRTGLRGSFDFTVEWAPEPEGSAASDPPGTLSDPIGPTSVQALRDQLGLKVEPIKGPLRILVIDHVERPSEN
jgi:bla regulator protein blaR1